MKAVQLIIWLHLFFGVIALGAIAESSLAQMDLFEQESRP